MMWQQSRFGLPQRSGNGLEGGCVQRRLNRVANCDTERRNGRSPRGDPESRLWVAVAGRTRGCVNDPARRRSAAGPQAGGVSVASRDDASAAARFVGVGGDWFVGFEVQVALDGETKFAAHGAKLREAYVAEFRFAHAEIAKSEGQAVAVELGE